MPTSPTKPKIACHGDVIVKGNLGPAAWTHRTWAYQRNGLGKAVDTHIQKTAHSHTEQEYEKLKDQGLPHISAKLFCKHSQVTFIPYGIVLKDERRTSNIERPTSNEKRISNTDSAVVAKATMAKSAHSTAISVSSFFPIKHSTLDVRCSFFSVNLPQSIRCKNTLALLWLPLHKKFETHWLYLCALGALAIIRSNDKWA